MDQRNDYARIRTVEELRAASQRADRRVEKRLGGLKVKAERVRYAFSFAAMVDRFKYRMEPLVSAAAMAGEMVEGAWERFAELRDRFRGRAAHRRRENDEAEVASAGRQVEEGAPEAASTIENTQE